MDTKEMQRPELDDPGDVRAGLRGADLFFEIAPPESELIEPPMRERLDEAGRSLVRLSTRGARGLGRAFALAVRLSFRLIVVAEQVLWWAVSLTVRILLRAARHGLHAGARGAVFILCLSGRLTDRLLVAVWRCCRGRPHRRHSFRMLA